MDQILGPDVSHHQPDPNWRSVAADGRFSFAWVKASEGAPYAFADYYAPNARQVKDLGLVQGAYHYLLVGHDGAEQARYFLEVAPEADLYAVDVEQRFNDAFSAAQIVATTEAFSAEFHAHKPQLFLYGRAFLRAKGIRSRMGCDLLWAPRYNGTQLVKANLGPVTDFGWDDASLKFWQFTNGVSGPVPHEVPGIGPCDISWFFGTLGELQDLASLPPERRHHPAGGATSTPPAPAGPAAWSEDDWTALVGRVGDAVAERLAVQAGEPVERRLRDFVLGQLDRRAGKELADDASPARKNGWHHEDDLIAIRAAIQQH
jgi:GH25 family lysozyme M1 (1,4-beta-N-acetylmuramidase)